MKPKDVNKELIGQYSEILEVIAERTEELLLLSTRLGELEDQQRSLIEELTNLLDTKNSLVSMMCNE